MKKKFIALSTISLFLLSGCGSNNNSTNEENQFSLNISSALSMEEGSDTLSLLNNSDEKNSKYTFAITGGVDADKFTIDSQTGKLHFKTKPDFENPTDANNDNIYEIGITITNAKNQSLNKTIYITITDNPADNGPEFTSINHTSVQENKLLNFTVEANSATSFSIIGGDDKNLFTIDNNGKLEFLNFIPDYEHSSDKNHDNVYEIIIQATDASNHSTSQKFNVTILDDKTEKISVNSFVFKTGQNDGPAPTGQPFGDDRNFDAKTIDGDRIIIVGDRAWEDSPHSKNVKVTFNEAIKYCNRLSNENYAGKNDWRLPIRLEMYQIINFNKEPTIDDIFQYSTNGDYWTSQILMRYGTPIDNTAFVITFRFADSFPLDMDKEAYVRCVSGAKYVDKEPLKQDEKGVFHDPTTGLEWAKDASHTTWTEAKERCEKLVFAGKSDWRLPNINELFSVMPIYNDEFLFDIDNDNNGDLDYRGPFWSSTDAEIPTHARKISNYWGKNWVTKNPGPNEVLGKDVLDHATEPKQDNYTRSICVRGGHL
jgi:hypothetical protein